MRSLVHTRVPCGAQIAITVSVVTIFPADFPAEPGKTALNSITAPEGTDSLNEGTRVVRRNVVRHEPAALQRAKRLLAGSYTLEEVALATGLSLSLVGRIARDEHRPTRLQPVNKCGGCGAFVITSVPCLACQARAYPESLRNEQLHTATA
jgi:hypothetical protein